MACEDIEGGVVRGGEELSIVVCVCARMLGGGGSAKGGAG